MTAAKRAPRGLATWSPERRLWRNVTKTETCWLWVGAAGANGYGHLTIDGRRVSVHRLSFEMHHRPLAPGEAVCHSCDVRNCVNPEHLFAGSLADNNRDMWAKGRGVANPVWLLRQRLTDEQRDEVVRRYGLGESGSSIASDFGVTRQYVSQLARRRGCNRG